VHFDRFEVRLAQSRSAIQPRLHHHHTCVCVYVLAAGLWVGVIHHAQEEDEGGLLLCDLSCSSGCVCFLSVSLAVGSHSAGFTAAELHIKKHFSFHTHHHHAGPQRLCVCVCVSQLVVVWGIKMCWKMSEMS